RTAFYPCYGLAEATLLVAGGDVAAAPVLRGFDSAALERHSVQEVDAVAAAARVLVGCGQAPAEQRVVIVDPDTHEPSAPGSVGEIWVAGTNVTPGYWDRPEESAHVFRARLAGCDAGPFLRTGDLGFVHAGELFVTGRLKELIVIRGRNHYPQDIEWTVEESHPALTPGRGAAFSLEVGGEEELVVADEVGRPHRLAHADAVVRAIRQAVAARHGLRAYGVVLLAPGQIPRTSSGKVRRQECRARFLADGWRVLARSLLATERDAPRQEQRPLTRQAFLSQPAAERDA